MIKRIFLFIIIMVVSFVLFSESFNKLSNDNNLISTVKEKGAVRVIVKMNVPNLFELTKLSTKFRTGNLKNINRYAMYDADYNLSMSIKNTAESVIYNLNNSFYELKYVFKTIPYISIIVNEDSLIKLNNDSMVLRIIQDKPIPLPRYEINPETEMSKPMLSNSVELIGADEAWAYGLTGKGWYVAVLDTGIRNTHEMFKDKQIIEACFSLGESYSDKNNGGCPNGKIEMYGSGSAAHSKHNVSGYDHGTHVSGIAAGNNKDYLFGVAKDADIIAVQVFTYFKDYDDVLSWTTDQLKGLEYVYSLRSTYNIAAVNMSLGGGSENSFCDDNHLKSIIDNLKSVGIVTAIATGNDGYCNSISSPACISSAVSVGGTDKFGNEYNYSNWKNGMVDLNAPGVSIRSATGSSNTSYSNWNGTSMATPHVAGTWALFRQFDSNLSVDEILEKLRKNRSDINSRCEGTKLKMQIDIEKTLEDFIKLFPPINFEMAQVRNKSLLQNEYINILSWNKNPLNDNKGVVSYKIYLFEDSNLIHLSTLSSSVFTYYHRNVEKRVEKTYVITSLNEKGEESVKYYQTIKF